MYSDDKKRFRNSTLAMGLINETFAISAKFDPKSKKIVILVRYRLYAPYNNVMFMSYIYNHVYFVYYRNAVHIITSKSLISLRLSDSDTQKD
jgi:hypothetical protein